MKNALKPVAFAGLLTLVAGCSHHHHHRQTSHYPPPSPPAPRPEVVVVTPPPPSRPAPPPTASRPAKEPWVDVTITTGERRVIREYVVVREDDNDQGHGKHGKKGKGKSLPPGLAKKAARGEDLPPGWQKKLRKGEVMSREVYQRCHPLPEEVIVRLPPPPPGTILVTIQGKVVRLLQATLEILDVFDVHV